MAPSQEDSGLSEETISVIEGQVKKGKTRKFFMIIKGSAIQTVVVFKKGQFGPKVMEAKKSGFKGEVSYGLVSGTGKNLVFQFAGNPQVAEAMQVDAFTDAVPVKDAKVKEFFSANGLDVKPDLQCITNVADAMVPGAGDEDEPAAANAAPAPAEQVAAPSTAETSNQPTASDAQAATEFATRLKAIKPDMDRVVLGNVAVSAQLKDTVGRAAGLARDKQFVAALALMNEIETLVGQGLQMLSPSGGPPSDDAAGQKAKLEEALRNLTPKLKQAVVDFPNKKSELLTPVATIKQQLAEGQLAEAKQGILAVAAALKQLAAAPAQENSAAPADGPRNQYEALLASVTPKFEKVMAANSLGDADKLQKVMQMAQTKATAGDFATAQRALEGLAKALDSALLQMGDGSQDTADADIEEAGEPLTKIIPNLIKYRTSLVEFSNARSAVKQQIETLVSSMGKQVPDEAAAAAALTDELNAINDELWDLIDAEINADDKDKPARAKILRSTLAQSVTNISSNPLITVVDRSPLASMSIRETLVGALNKILSQIAA